MDSSKILNTGIAIAGEILINKSGIKTIEGRTRNGLPVEKDKSENGSLFNNRPVEKMLFVSENEVTKGKSICGW